MSCYFYIPVSSFITLLILINTSLAHKILIVPVYHKSHVTSLLTIADELDRRGHDVTMLDYEGLHGIPLQSSVKGSKVKQFQLKLRESRVSHDASDVMEGLSLQFVHHLGNQRRMVDLVKASPYNLCNILHLFTNESFEKLANERFDLVIVDGTLFTMCFYLIPHRLAVPWITYSDYLDPWLVRLPWLPSFVPFHFTTFTERMNFSDRLKNTLITTYARLFGTKITVDDEVMTSYKQYGPFTSLDELASRSLMFLVTSHIVLDYAKPSMPNVVQIGGLTTGEPKALPPNIQEFLDEAEKGVILISFGTMLSTFPEDIASRFSSAFSRLDGNRYRVMWRFANATHVRIPSNVMVSGWLPQNDILAHPKTKLFITHCGNNGQFEAIYNKVPMIGFPFFGDQTYNAVRLQHKGLGLMMQIKDFTSDQLLHNINTILSDPTYTERVTKASEIFKSSLERPAEKAASAIEHVCRYGGDHLHSAGNDLYLFQYLMLDILALFVVIIAVLGVIVYKISRAVYLTICLRFNSRRVRFAKDNKKKK